MKKKQNKKRPRDARPFQSPTKKKIYFFFFLGAAFLAFFFGAAFLAFLTTFFAAFFFFIMEEKVKVYEVQYEPIYVRMLTKKRFNVKFFVMFKHNLGTEIFLKNFSFNIVTSKFLERVDEK